MQMYVQTGQIHSRLEEDTKETFMQRENQVLLMFVHTFRGAVSPQEVQCPEK